MNTTLYRRAHLDHLNLWQRWCNWITSTQNRIYIGWFGVLMVPTLLVATTCFVLAFITAPPS